LFPGSGNICLYPLHPGAGTLLPGSRNIRQHPPHGPSSVFVYTVPLGKKSGLSLRKESSWDKFENHKHFSNAENLWRETRRSIKDFLNYSMKSNRSKELEYFSSEKDGLG
jgi:hypothetical protein